MGKRKKNKRLQTHDIAPYESKRQKHEGNYPDTSCGGCSDETTAEQLSHSPPHNDMQILEQIPKDHHKRRTGTASVSGHFYETKLILLLLFRATHNNCISKFYLGSNLDDIGAIDDIVFKYYKNGDEKPRFLFMQCYHRENPTKDEVNNGDVMSKGGHFSIHKLYDSYLSIKKKFCDAEDNCMFENRTELERVEFVVYTSAKVNFEHIAISAQNKNELIVTNNGPIFQFDYDALFKNAKDREKKFFENEEESRFFLSKYYLYTYQAREGEVEEILKKELRQCYMTSNINRLFLKLHNEIQNWWMLQNAVPYLTETCQLFSEIIQEVKHDSFLTTLEQLYVSDKDEIKINLKFNEDAVCSLDLRHFLETVEKILIIKTICAKLTIHKVWQYFQHIGADNCIFIDLQHATKNNLYEKIKHEFQKTLNDVWILQCSHVDEINKMYNDIEHIMLKDVNKKVIFVTSNDIDKLCFNIPIKNINDEKICLSHLTEESLQRIILRENVWVFQGEDMHFSKIVNKNWEHAIDGKILSKLISKEKLHIGREVTDFRYDIVKETYIDQELLCSVEIEKTFIKNNGQVDATKFKEFLVVYDREWVDLNVSGDQEILLISNENINFTEICIKYPKQCVHLFKQYNNTFVWVKTQGNLNNIRNYVVHNSKSNNFVAPNTVKDIEGKTIIVAAEPGMGKSTLLTYLCIKTKKIKNTLKEENLWIVRINLLDYDSELKELKTKNISRVEAMKFLQKAAISERNQLEIMNLEIKLFNCFYNSGNVVLLFDGFDEICPNYIEIVMKLLIIFKNDIKIKKLWITTRPYNIQNEIEDELGSFAYTIVPFSKETQKKFLNILLENKNNCVLKSDELLLLFYNSVDDKNESFFSIPLNMYMIVTVLTQQEHDDENKEADELQVSSKIIYTLSKCYSRKRRIASYYSRNSISDVNENRKINSYILYNMFLKHKFHEIRFREKTLISKEHKENLDMKDTIEREYKYTMDTHKKLAMKAMFPEELTKLNMLLKKEMRELNNQIQTIKKGGERTGIVYRIVNNVPTFVHVTFVEYFIMEFICDFIVDSSSESVEDVLNFFINDVLIKDNYKNIRQFFDCKLATGFSFGAEDEENENNAIELFLFNLLLGQRTPSLVTIAIKEQLINIVEFSLHIIVNSLKQTNLNSFVQWINEHALFYLAYNHQHVKFIATILQRVANLIEEYSKPQFSNNVCMFVQFIAEAIEYGGDDVKILLDVMCEEDYIKEILNTVVHCETFPNIIHRVTENNKFSILLPYLKYLSAERLHQLLIMPKNSGHTPAHNAASWDDFNFFYYIRDVLKNKQHFREICLARNIIKQTPMDCFNISSFENTQKNEYMTLLYDLCPYDIEMINSTGLNNENFEDICKFIAKNYSLFQSLSEDMEKCIFFQKTLEYSKYLYKNDESCNNMMLTFALENDNKIIVDILLSDVSNARLVEIISKMYKHAIPLEGLSPPRIHSKIFLSRLKKLDENQLLQIIELTDSRGCTPAHYAAMDENHEFFDFLMDTLQKEDFQRICLTRCNSFLKFTPLDIWFGSNQTKHLYKVINVFQNESEVDVNHGANNNQSLNELNNEHDSAADCASKPDSDSKSNTSSESEVDSESESDSIIVSDSDSDFDIKELGSIFEKLWNYFCPIHEINE